MPFNLLWIKTCKTHRENWKLLGNTVPQFVFIIVKNDRVWRKSNLPFVERYWFNPDWKIHLWQGENVRNSFFCMCEHSGEQKVPGACEDSGLAADAAGGLFTWTFTSLQNEGCLLVVELNVGFLSLYQSKCWQWLSQSSNCGIEKIIQLLSAAIKMP